MLFAELQRNNLQATWPEQVRVRDSQKRLRRRRQSSSSTFHPSFQVYILDTLLTYRCLDDEYRDELHKVTATVDWSSSEEIL